MLLGLGLLLAGIVTGLTLRTHPDTAAAEAGEEPGVSANETPASPSLPMKRLEGADEAEILEAIRKQQSGGGGDTDQAGQPPTEPEAQQD